MTPRATTLRVIRDISFGDNYNDVVLFNNVEEQTEFFMSQIGYEFEEQSYQRPEAGYFKVSRPYKDMVRYCYLMFRNSSHEDKWWYAFVDEIVYINDNTTGVRFHIDIMQSYMFDYTLGESFVVREHAATDEPGSNIVPENIYFGDYVTSTFDDQLEVDGSKCAFGYNTTLTPEDMCVVIAYNPAIFDVTTLSGVDKYLWKENLYGGTYQGVRFICIPFTPKLGDAYIKEAVQLLDSIMGTIDLASLGGVISAYMMPLIFLPPKGEPSFNNVRYSIAYNPPTGIPGYSGLKNKKLLTYPYTAINVTNMRTEGVDYAYEYFINRKPTFMFEGTLSFSPSCLCYPAGYKGKTFAVEEGVTLDSYPLVNWGQDGFSEWCSNNLFKTALGAGLMAATGGASAFVSGLNDPVGAIKHYSPTMTHKEAVDFAKRAPGVTGLLTDRYAGERAVGTACSVGVRAAIGVISQTASTPPAPTGVNAHELLFGNLFGKKITIRRKHIRPEYARKLDDYFTRYGYATNEVKTPDLRSRPLWNYIQLQNAHLDNINCPMGVAAAIRGVYEKGVTFWRPHAKVGDYENQSNSV